MRESVYFTSDHHFGAGPDQPARIERFVRWLDGLDDAAAIYLLGDVFDFWLDYPTFMPKTHMEVLYALSRVRDRGVEMVFVGGNHDIWCEEYSVTEAIRHGCMMAISQGQYDAIVAAYPGAL